MRPSFTLVGQSASGLALCLLGVISLPVAAAQAQGGERPQKRSYVHFPFAGDLEERLKQQLANAREHEKLEDVLRDLKRHPKFDGLDPATLMALYETNPLIRSQVNELLKKAADNPDWQASLPETLNHLLKQQGGPLSGPDPFGAGAARDGPRPPQEGTSRPAAAPPNSPTPAADEGEDTLLEWLQEWMEGAEDSQLAELLRESPAFQRGMLDLQRILLERRDDGGRFPSTALGKLMSGLQMPEGWEWSRRVESFWSRLADLPKPSLPVPQLSWRGGLAWEAPVVPAPTWSLGRLALWLVIGAGLALLLWQVLGRTAWPARSAGPGESLGPWPVHPGRISNRTELVLAFDYLSLLLLGPQARSRNHRAIASALPSLTLRVGMDTNPKRERGIPERQQAAEQLALLYEQARYAPADEALAPEALTAARRNLCLLAGVAEP